MSNQDLWLGIGVIVAALVILFFAARNWDRHTRDSGGGVTSDSDGDGGGDGGGD
jgi:hypothetical protein